MHVSHFGTHHYRSSVESSSLLAFGLHLPGQRVRWLHTLFMRQESFDKLYDLFEELENVEPDMDNATVTTISDSGYQYEALLSDFIDDNAPMRDHTAYNPLIRTSGRITSMDLQKVESVSLDRLK